MLIMYPAANELTAMIPSRTVRNYVEESGFECSDFEKACMIIHNKYISYTDRKRYLIQLLDKISSDDPASQNLASQIKTYLEYFDDAISRFTESDNQSVYGLKFRDELNPNYYATPTYAIFTDYSLAYKAGLKGTTAFAIEKVPILQTSDPYSAEEQRVEFSRRGDIISYFDPKTTPFNDSITYYEKIDRAYCRVPNPFERGDIVALVGDDSRVGIVETTPEEWDKLNRQLRYIKKLHGLPSEYSDVVLKVSILKNDGTFESENINPTRLEYYTPSTSASRDHLLSCAQNMYLGKACLSELCFYMEQYKEDREDELY